MCTEQLNLINCILFAFAEDNGFIINVRTDTFNMLHTIYIRDPKTNVCKSYDVLCNDSLRDTYNIINDIKKDFNTLVLNKTQSKYLSNDVDAGIIPQVIKKIINEKYGISSEQHICMSDIPEITDVIFNDPAIIVFWSDGTKTVVKADNEEFDPEKGLAMAISKKALGNDRGYYEVFRKWIGKYNKKQAKLNDSKNNKSVVDLINDFGKEAGEVTGRF